MKKPRSACSHGVESVPRRGSLSPKKACEACGATEELRICQTCGDVGCCESHEGHDEAHFEATGHPFIRPRTGRFSGSTGWLWCYGCRAYLE